MFEKFTENAIKVIMHSREEARRLEFGYVQPEHLFLGILHDRVGVSSLVLGKLGVDLRKVRRIVERLIGRAYTIVPLDQVSFAMNAMKIISNSIAIASKYPKEAVSSEHILLSLINSDEENIKKILEELNIDAEDIETEIRILWQDDENFSHIATQDLPEYYSAKYLTSLSKLVLEEAREDTIRQGHIFIGTEQILLSLARNKFDSIAGKILKKFGLDEDTINIEIHRLIGKGSGSNLDLLKHSNMVEKSLEYAWLEARRFRYGKLGTGHLLMGITTMDNCTSSHLLKYLNINPEQVRWTASSILKKHFDNPEPNLTLEQIENDISLSEVSEVDSEMESIEEVY